MPRAFRRACAIGGIAAVVIVIVLGSAGRIGLASPHQNGGFYDAQARAWLQGHWDVDPNVVGTEGYQTDHGVQMYFGAFPAVLRLPVLAVTDEYDGRLGQVSAVAALVLGLVATARLLWTGRWAWTASKEVRTSEAILAGVVVFVFGAGSNLTLMAATPVVFHEAILWAAVLAVAATDQLVRALHHPSTRSIALAGVFAGLTLLTRVTTGVAMMLPLIVLAAIAVGGSVQHRLGLRLPPRFTRPVTAIIPDPGAWRRHTSILLLVAVAPLLLYGGMNTARFGHPWKVPFDQQIIYLKNPERAASLAHNGNSLFGLQFIPSNLVAYVRPDGIRVAPRLALATFPDFRDTKILGSVEHDYIESTGSIPTTMPLVTVLAVVGIVVILRSRQRSRLASLRLPLIATAFAAFIPLVYSVIAYRMLGETVPLLVLTTAVGLVRVTEVTRSWRRGPRTAAVVGLTAWSVWVAVGLSLTQLMLVPVVSAEDSARFVHAIADLPGNIGAADFPVTDTLGDPRLWTLGRAPDCRGVYIANGGWWTAVERRAGTGAYHLRVTPPPDDGQVHPLVATRDGKLVIGLEHKDGHAVVRYSTDSGASWQQNPDERVADSPSATAGAVELMVDIDFFAELLTVSGEGEGGQTQLRLAIGGPDQPVDLVPSYPGTVEQLPLPTPLCDRWQS